MSAPSWLKGDHEREFWAKPWTVPLSSHEAADFKRKLWAHGLISPHFTRAEAASRQYDGDVIPIPDSLRAKAQYHGFALERVRHDLGDRALNPLDWYRDPVHNAEVGGASQSAHMEAWATDWSDAERIRLGSARFDAAMQRQFAYGGIGTYQGHVRHVDNGAERRWTY
jgi:hypothetical protein